MARYHGRGRKYPLFGYETEIEVDVGLYTDLAGTYTTLSGYITVLFRRHTLSATKRIQIQDSRNVDNYGTESGARKGLAYAVGIGAVIDANGAITLTNDGSTNHTRIDAVRAR